MLPKLGIAWQEEAPTSIVCRYVEFNSTTHYALHLMPFIGLALNYSAYRTYYQHGLRTGGKAFAANRVMNACRYTRWQGAVVLVVSVAYFAWILFLHSVDKVCYYVASAACPLTAL